MNLALAMAALGLQLATLAPSANPDSHVPIFDYRICAPMATHIVVTTPDGIVLECWRGNLKPGERVGIGAEGLSPRLLLPFELTRLRSEHPLGGWYRPGCLVPEINAQTKVGEVLAPQGFEQSRQFVLFLRQIGSSTREGRCWMPAMWRSAPYIMSRESSFGFINSWDMGVSVNRSSFAFALAASIAWVEDGVVFGMAMNRELSPQIRDTFSTWHHPDIVIDKRLHRPDIVMDLVSRSLLAFRARVMSCGPLLREPEYEEEEPLAYGSCINPVVLKKPAPAMDLGECVANASDIVVVDGQGWVTEVWKGSCRLGNRIGDPKTPVGHDKESGFGWESPGWDSCPESGFWSQQASFVRHRGPFTPEELEDMIRTDQHLGLERQCRQVLFLVNSGTNSEDNSMATLPDDYPLALTLPDPPVRQVRRDIRHVTYERISQTSWEASVYESIPDIPTPRRDWQPACHSGGFECAVAWIDECGNVSARHAENLNWDWPDGMFRRLRDRSPWRSLGGEAEFRQRVRDLIEGCP